MGMVLHRIQLLPGELNSLNLESRRLTVRPAEAGLQVLLPLR